MERASPLISWESVRMYVISARCSPFTGRPKEVTIGGSDKARVSSLYMYIYVCIRCAARGKYRGGGESSSLAYRTVYWRKLKPANHVCVYIYI